MKNVPTLIVLLFCTFVAVAEEKKITTSDGVELYVKVAGEGEPLLYIHGGPGSGSHWFEEFFGDFMEKHYTVIYLDQRGVGRSTSPKDGNFSLDRVSRDFEEVRQALGIEKWFTLGHSFGGILQMGYSERYPESHLGMLMINCTLSLKQSACESWIPKAAEFLGESYTCENDSVPVMKRMNEYGGKLREQHIFWKMAYSDPAQEEVMNKTYEAIDSFNYDLGNAVLGRDEYWVNFKPATENFHLPVLFFYGNKDWMVGPEHYQGVNFPNMLLWRSQVGHLPFQENKEDLKEAILSFKEYTARKF